MKLKGAVDEPTLFITWPLPAMSSPDYRLLQLAIPSVASDLERYAFMFKWGHSASTQILGGPRAPEVEIEVRVNVDTARHHHEPAGVDLVAVRRQPLIEGRNTTAADPQVRHHGVGGRGHEPAADHQVVGHATGPRGARKERTGSWRSSRARPGAGRRPG